MTKLGMSVPVRQLLRECCWRLVRQDMYYHKTSLTLCKGSFLWRGAAGYERLPWDFREIKEIGEFKKNLNEWVKDNIQL